MHFSLIVAIPKVKSSFESCFLAKKSLSEDLFICAFLRGLGGGDPGNRARVVGPILGHLKQDAPISVMEIPPGA